MRAVSYAERVSELLKRRSRVRGPLVLDLFGGCGGLSLGFETIGFRVTAFERDDAACATYRNNLWGPCHQVELDTDFQFPDASVIIAGPPCQPFSVNGNQEGHRDKRNGFEVFISAVKQVRPEIWMFENVRGLL
ncbi:MAG: DNA cytosine methyltransferase, partial [Terriglobia bacterium]